MGMKMLWQKNKQKEKNRLLFYKKESKIVDVFGRLAQLVRAPASQAGGRRFESYIAHEICRYSVTGSATDL